MASDVPSTPTRPASEAGARLKSPGPSLATALLAGLAGGLIAAASVTTYGQPFVTPMYAGMFPPPGWNAQAVANRYSNAAVSVGLLGLSLGGCLGAAGGASRRSAASAALGLACGLSAGAAFGAAGGWGSMAVYSRLGTAGWERTQVALAVHVTAFLPVGLGAAAGAASVLAGPARVAGAGAAGGMLAGMIYPVSVLIGFPPMMPDYPIPERVGPMLLWAVIPGLLGGAALALAPRTSGSRD